MSLLRVRRPLFVISVALLVPLGLGACSPDTDVKESKGGVIQESPSPTRTATRPSSAPSQTAATNSPGRIDQHSTEYTAPKELKKLFEDAKKADKNLTELAEQSSQSAELTKAITDCETAVSKYNNLAKDHLPTVETIELPPVLDFRNPAVNCEPGALPPTGSGGD